MFQFEITSECEYRTRNTEYRTPKWNARESMNENEMYVFTKSTYSLRFVLFFDQNIDNLITMITLDHDLAIFDGAPYPTL